MTTGASEPVPLAVAVVGSLNLDLIVAVTRLPCRGETVVGTRTRTGPGGKGANQAAAAAALSAHIAMIGRVGDDSAGRMLVDDLARRGVDVSAVQRTADVPTATAMVAVEQDTGENLIVVAPGANAALTVADVQVEIVRAARVLLLQLEVPVGAVAAAIGASTGCVVLNPAPSTELSPSLLAAVDVLVPNEWELSRLAGTPPRTESVDRLADIARSVAPVDVVVTMGARGALVVPRDGTPTVVDPPAVTAVDTTGAGDCFCGALAVGGRRASRRGSIRRCRRRSLDVRRGSPRAAPGSGCRASGAFGKSGQPVVGRQRGEIHELVGERRDDDRCSRHRCTVGEHKGAGHSHLQIWLQPICTGVQRARAEHLLVAVPACSCADRRADGRHRRPCRAARSRLR